MLRWYVNVLSEHRRRLIIVMLLNIILLKASMASVFLSIICNNDKACRLVTHSCTLNNSQMKLAFRFVIAVTKETIIVIPFPRHIRNGPIWTQWVTNGGFGNNFMSECIRISACSYCMLSLRSINGVILGLVCGFGLTIRQAVIRNDKW